MIAFQSVFPPFRGGISRFSDHLYKILASQTTVEAYNFTKLYPPILFPGKTQFLESPVENYAEQVLHAYNPFNWKRSVSRIIDSGTDVYLFSHWHPFFAPSQIRVIKEIKKTNPNVEIAALIHNVIPHERFPLQHKLTRQLFNLVDVPIVLSEQTRLQYRSLMKNREPVKLYHPVYTQKWPEDSRETIRKKLGYAENDIVVLFFGLIRAYKGLDTFIEALNLINLDNTRIKPLIVGEFYIEPDRVINRIKREHLPHYEIINRFVPDEEAASYMLASDLMVLPYKSASQSGVLSDALNFELPAIVSDLPGLTEHIEHGKNGYIFPPEDAVSLAQLLFEASENKELDLMRANVALKRDSLNWNKFAQELLRGVGL